jgi:signal transduction histidine kinase
MVVDGEARILLMNGAAERLFARSRDGLLGAPIEVLWPERLRSAREAADAASLAKGEFVMSMSHELRTPLHSILGFSQLLQRDERCPLSERHRSMVAHIVAGAEHLLSLVNDVLDLSRVEAGGVAIEADAVDVPYVLERVREALDPMAAQAGVRLDLVTAAVEPPMIFADRTRFMQILLNLGSNAVKYNRAGGKVTFTLTVPDTERVRVTVSDTGVGIPESKRDRLFRPFQRLGQETGDIEGTGLGLTITKRLAELMGGSVDFRSRLGVGSHFWVNMSAHPSRRRSITPPGIRVVTGREAGDELP